MAKAPVKYYVVDAFTDSAFKGNPAAVCLLEEERDEKWLQAVAAEFNISETSYLTRITDSVSPYPRFRLRWFTPVTEVDLCGHATLATAHTLFATGLVNSNIIEFDTLSGILTAEKVSDSNPTDVSKIQNGRHHCFLIELNFPAVPITEFNSSEVSAISKALNGAQLIDVKRTTTADDLFVVLPSAKSVIELEPQFDAILKCPGRGIIVSGVSPSDSEFDFSSRFFCPKNGINEDPVTGSAHCSLALYWSEKLRKCDFMAYQASARGGILGLHLDKKNQRVLLRGKAVTVMEGSLLVVLPCGKSVAELQPSFDDIKRLGARGIIVSGIASPESGFDIASARGGMVKVHLDEENQRVFLQGKAVTVMEGTLLV
ncbi:Phenazine biosynthesis PhzF protein [Corchorus olitorius]|uniref:Phenazine biosynthesis PhzF protein n=1 Tax=Corchorus olitorius TaxID=93759 RepID=A0A1R3KD35_9ROSI|nr:Phenazine biosynthesis PhzF protein [Corchorus olitorius]